MSDKELKVIVYLKSLFKIEMKNLNDLIWPNIGGDMSSWNWAIIFGFLECPNYGHQKSPNFPDFKTNFWASSRIYSREILLIGISMNAFVNAIIFNCMELEPPSTALMKKGKAFLLLAIYVVFVAYIIGRSLDAGWANQISDSLHQILQWLPQIG